MTFKTNLNDTNPAARIGYRLSRWQVTSYYVDVNGDLVRDASAEQRNFGGVDARTGTTETIGLSSQGKLVTLTNAGAIAVSLDSASADNIFACAVEVAGAGTATLTPTSGLINGVANLAITPGSGGWLFFTGTNWFCIQGGGGSSSPLTTKGDLWGYSTTNDRVPVGTNAQLLAADSAQATGVGWKTIGGDIIGPITALLIAKLNGFAISTATPNDGEQFQWNSGTAKYELVLDKPVFFPSAVPGKPAASQPVIIYTCAGAPITFPANFTSPSAKGSVGVNPTATATYTVQKNGVTAGTIVISTLGVFTFATTSGLPFTLNIGDRFTAIAPGTQDATLSDVGFTLLGTRGATVSPGTTNPVIVWMGQYDITGTTTYGTYNEVGYLGSSYIAKQPSTGVLPTNTTYWDLVSAAGSNGVAAASDIQNQTYLYCVDSGVANALVVAPSPAMASYVSGLGLEVKVAANQTAATTINVSGLGTKAVKNQDGSALVSGTLKAGGIYRMTYDGTNFQLIGAAAASLTVQEVDGSPAIAGVTQINFPNGSVTNPSGTIVQVAGGLVLLEQHTASGSASLDFTACISSAFDEYAIEVINIVPATNGQSLFMRCSINGGSSYDSANNYAWTGFFVVPSANANQGSSSTSALTLGQAIANTAAWFGTNGHFRFFNPANNGFKHYTGQTSSNSTGNANVISWQSFSGYYNNASAVNAIQFLFSSGNIASGIIRVYGVCK
jgi:hypothetical protein